MPPKLEKLTAMLEPKLFRVLLGLPVGVQRRLAGRPVVVDGQTLDTETQWMLRIQKLARLPAAETLSMSQARREILRQTRLAGGAQPIGETRDLEIPGADAMIAARLYVPRSQVGSRGKSRPSSGWPMLFFVHGGGMVFGSLDSHDSLCRFLAERADMRVLSIDYRLAPEHPFPAAVDDCWASFEWLWENTEKLGVDPERIAVGGDSAGGYLAAVTALRAAESGIAVAYQMLIYPMTNMAEQSQSKQTFGEGFFLTKAFMDLAEASYLSQSHDRRDPRVSVHFTERLPDGLAPAFIATAGFDPLRDEGEAYARLLAEAGVAVETQRFPGLIHGFANIVGAGRSNRAAVAVVAARLKAAL